MSRMRHPSTLIDRFWSRVNKTETCWLWTGYLDKDGYGQITVTGKDPVSCARSDGKPTPRKAHRISYELANGPIPDGQDVLHSCDTPACVRPAHFFLGDQALNDADRDAKGRNVLGIKHPLHKLNDDDVRSIRSTYAKNGIGGLSMPKLAATYGVDVALIHRIIHRKSWPHVV